RNADSPSILKTTYWCAGRVTSSHGCSHSRIRTASPPRTCRGSRPSPARLPGPCPSRTPPRSRSSHRPTLHPRSTPATGSFSCRTVPAQPRRVAWIPPPAAYRCARAGCARHLPCPDFESPPRKPGFHPSQRTTIRTPTMRIAIAGASGRMGRELIEAIVQESDVQLAVALDQPGSASCGQDAAAFLGRNSGVLITDDLEALADADCLIDFTRPEGTLRHLDACLRHGVNMVIGTTGFDESQRQQIQAASARIGIVFAPNMSVGVNVTLKLLDMAARILQDYDVEVFEAHHKRKVDAPSGTALKMGETIAEAWGKQLADVADWARHGHTG